MDLPLSGHDITDTTMAASNGECEADFPPPQNAPMAAEDRDATGMNTEPSMVLLAGVPDGAKRKPEAAHAYAAQDDPPPLKRTRIAGDVSVSADFPEVASVDQAYRNEGGDFSEKGIDEGSSSPLTPPLVSSSGSGTGEGTGQSSSVVTPRTSEAMSTTMLAASTEDAIDPAALRTTDTMISSAELVKSFGRRRKPPTKFGSFVSNIATTNADVVSAPERAQTRCKRAAKPLLKFVKEQGKPSFRKKQTTAHAPYEKSTTAFAKRQQKATPSSKKLRPVDDPKASVTKPKRSNALVESIRKTSSGGRLTLNTDGLLSDMKAVSSRKSYRSSSVTTLPSPAKLALSLKLAKREPLATKPLPSGCPEVWADSRQALCETLPYFKSPQSGCYQNDGHVYGFLFDSVGHCRECMDENVIVCRAGGGMEMDATGNMVQRKDHTLEEAQVQSVLNDMAHQNPIVVICGNRNTAAICKMPHQYCVLGWYKPTDVWAEKTLGKGDKIWTTIKYRLERLNRHGPVWHTPENASLSAGTDDHQIAGERVDASCKTCRKQSPQVYLRSWMCLTLSCPWFWKLHGSKDAPYGSEGLEYDPGFLLHRSKLWNDGEGSHEAEPAPLRPSLPNIGDQIGDYLTYINTRGICCPKCGRCNSRRLFRGWICENEKCDFKLITSHQPVFPTMLHTPWDTAPTLVRNRHDPLAKMTVKYKYGYKIATYTFEGFGIEGRFVHAAATKQVLEEPHGPNDMFQALQREDMGLERRTFAVKRRAGEDFRRDSVLKPNPPPVDEIVEGDLAVVEDGSNLDDTYAHDEKKPAFAPGDLMTAFSMNYGMPYKFVAGGASKPFEDGPWPVPETRRRLNWAARVFLPPSQDQQNSRVETDFNEELIFAYLEGQKIEYHDDGEEGLGPRIATLSLGGRAKMFMRMKAKHHVGCTKSGMFLEERPRPNTVECEGRTKAWTKLQELRAEPTKYAAQRRAIPKELGIYEKRNKKPDDLVSITLSHGDIVLMDGFDIQKYLEHKVLPESHLRFALTCRTVEEGHLKPEELPTYEVKRDDQTYEGPQL